MDSRLLNVVVFAYALLAIWVAFILVKNRGRIDCADLVTNRQGKLSRVALAQLSGVVVASWIPIHMASAQNEKLDYAVLAVCLAYLAAVEGFSKWLAHKEKGGQQ